MDTLNQSLGTLKHLCPSPAKAPSQNLDMKYQLYRRYIQNRIHLYFIYESNIQHHIFFLPLSFSDSFQIHHRFVGWITQRSNFLYLKQTVLTYLPPIEKQIRSYEAIVELFTGSEQLSK